jgi:hypothetical protein
MMWPSNYTKIHIQKAIIYSMIIFENICWLYFDSVEDTTYRQKDLNVEPVMFY